VTVVHFDGHSPPQTAPRRARASACLAAILGLAAIADSSGARAEDLDAGKSGARLFTSNCTICHRTPKGLGRRTGPALLANFMQLHYTANSASAAELAVYLTAVNPPTGVRRPGAAPHQTIRAAAATRDRSPRPPVALARP